MSVENDTHTVDLIGVEGNIANLLMSLGFSQQFLPSRRVKSSKATVKRQTLPSGMTEIPVRVVCCESARVVYVNLVSHDDQTEVMMQEIQEAITQNFGDRLSYLFFYCIQLVISTNLVLHISNLFLNKFIVTS